MRRTLTIRNTTNWASRLRRDARRAFAGEAVGEQLVFADPALFFGKLTANRWALVQLLQAQGPAGVREVARRAGRDVRRMHDDIQALLALGLLEKTEDGRIACPWDDIHVDMHLRAA